MDSSLNLLTPYTQSSAFDDVEKAMQSIFITAFHELYGETIQDIHYFGMPHLGSPKVVERFTKQDGLVVLRRPSSSDEIMRVIYSNWRSLASKRGLAFLEFVLQMLWADQWEIHRLYHSKDRSSAYPNLVTTMPTVNSFLTSRINITLDQDIDVEEVLSIAPILSKLVPANIVANISSGLELGETSALGLACGYVPYMIKNVEFFDTLEGIRIPFTDWGFMGTYKLFNMGVVRYQAYKTDLVDMIRSHADYDLRAKAVEMMSFEEYHQLDAIFDAILAMRSTALSHEVLEGSQQVVALIPPDPADSVASAGVVVQRIIASQNILYRGQENVQKVLDYFEWYYLAGEISHKVPAPIHMTTEKMYVLGDFKSYIDALSVAVLKVADQVANDPLWANYVLQDLVLYSQTELQYTYKQHYTENDIAGEYLIVVDYVNNPDFVAVNATVDAPVSSVDLSNMFVTARTEAVANNDYTLQSHVNLAELSAYQKDDIALATNYLYEANLVTFSFAQIVDQMILNLMDNTLIYYVSATEYLSKIIQTAFSKNPNERLITIEDLRSQLDQNVA